MPLDLTAIVDPRFILLGWAAGLALVAAVVSLLGIVGPGFTWLTGGTAGVMGLVGWFVPGTSWSAWGTLAAAIAMGLARNRPLAGLMLLGASLTYLVDATYLGGWILAVTAALVLGGVTGEMMLGHWYLVDPRLPRWALRGLAGVGIGGLLLEGLVVRGLGVSAWSGATTAWVTLLGLSVILMLAVIGALRQPAYSGVMAATGLSYLAVLTSLGAVFLGRALAAGVGPFSG